MRLARFDDGGGARLGVIEGDAVKPLANLSSRYPTMLSLIAGGEEALAAAGAAAATAASIPLVRVRLLAPIERPGKYLAIGMNYRKHMEEEIGRAHV